MRSFIQKLATPTTAVALAVLGLAACSKSAETPAAAAPASADKVGDAAGLAASKAELAKYSAAPTFIIPSDVPAVDANAAKGKKIFIINTTDQLPGAIKWIEGIERAMKPYGVSITKIDGKGTPTEYNKGIRQAIAQKADVIYNLAIAPEYVKESLKAAKEANIPVVSATDGRPDLKDIKNNLPGLVAEVSVDYKKVGELQADWFIASSEGKGHALFISNLDQPSSSFMVEAFKKRVAENCPGCTVEDKDVPAVQVASRIPTLIQTTLRANPAIDYVIPGFDFQVPLIVSALKQANLTDKVKIGSWDASGPVLNLMKDPASPVHMDMSAPYNWNSYASADTLFRVLAGAKPYVWGSEATHYFGVRIFSKDVVKDWTITGFDDARNFGITDDMVAQGYTKIWGEPKK